jgi:hypothetical protein
VVKRAARAHSPYVTAFGANFALVASLNLVGDQVESSVAHTLRRLEREVERDPYVVDAALTVSDPGDTGNQGR